MRLLGFLSVCTLFVIPLYIRYFEEASFSVFESYSFTLLVCVAIFINYVAFVDKAVKYVFVKVTTPEKKRLYDCVITFLTNKATFVAAFVSFGFHEVLLWTSYCLIMVVLRCTVSLARYRLSLIRGQPFAFTPLRTLRKLLGAVIAVAYINAALGYLLWTSVATWNVKLLLGYDVISLGVVLLRTVPGLIVQLVDQDWLKRERLVSQADMIGELFGFAVTYASFVHIALERGGVFTIINLMLAVAATAVFGKASKRVAAFRAFANIARSMRGFRTLTSKELIRDARDDVCVICRETMSEAVELPCTHLYHARCVQIWIKDQSICPTCRAPLEALPRAAPTASTNRRRVHVDTRDVDEVVAHGVDDGGNGVDDADVPDLVDVRVVSTARRWRPRRRADGIVFRNLVPTGAVVPPTPPSEESTTSPTFAFRPSSTLRHRFSARSSTTATSPSSSSSSSTTSTSTP